MSATPIDALKSKVNVSTANVQLDTPRDSLEAAFLKFGGKIVRGATPKPADAPDPDHEAFAEHGGKFVGKVPVAMPPKD